MGENKKTFREHERPEDNNPPEKDGQPEGVETLLFPTSRFGELEVPKDNVLSFPWGLIGFEEVQRFVIVEHPSGGPFRWLQAMDQPQLAFPITDPCLFFENYQVPASPDDLGSVQLDEAGEGLVLVIVSVQQQPRSITANLQGPLLINPRTRIGRQLVLHLPGFTTRHPIGVEKEAEAEPTGILERKSC
jgi:flagellar assembly factor FliW